MGLWLLIIMVVVAVLLLSWTTRQSSRGRAPGIRWHGIDWKRPNPPKSE